MKKAPILSTENERIKALLELNILDTPPEIQYDDLALIASEICQTPIALVSLVDSDRQWFKAKVGLEVSQTSRDVSFCGHAIEQAEIFEVPDAFADERFHDNPLVTGKPLVRFYAGAPLILADGSAIGTLCVIDHQPRKLSESQKSALTALARQVVFNISERKIRENVRIRDAELRGALANLQNLHLQNTALLSNMSEGLVFQDQSGKIISHNPAALKILGLTSDQLNGRTSLDPKWKAIREDGTDLPGEEHPAMVSLITGREIRGFLMGLSLPSGELKWISINSTPFQSDEKSSARSVVTTFADVTAEREKKLNLIESAKMSSLGAMAGGIAHEINTPLATIKSSAEVLMTRVEKGLADNDAVLKSMNKIIEVVDRVAKVVHAMRVISRDTKNDQFAVTSLRQVVEDAVSLCHDRISAHSVEVHVDCEDLWFNGRSGEICQVILNLLANSLDAISASSQKWIRVTGKKHGANIELAVSDSGPGIANQVAARMMEPFFTTKPVGKGTGLGLSISKTIAEDHSGTLYRDARSQVTRMVLELPLLQKQGRAA